MFLKKYIKTGSWTCLEAECTMKEFETKKNQYFKLFEICFISVIILML
jgi:hypothetical protein